MTVKEILETNINGVGGNFTTYLAPNIPEKKLINAVNHIAHGINISEVLAICDGTIFGSAKDGMVFTETTFFGKNYGTPFSIRYENITKVEIEEKNIVLYDGEKIVWTNNFYNSQKLAELLTMIVANQSVSSEKSENDVDENNKTELNKVEQKDSSQINISLDYTMNKHKLPLKTYSWVADSFLGLKLGSTMLENLFQLRCLGWKESEFYHQKKTFTKENSVTIVLMNENASVQNCKIEHLILTYSVKNIEDTSLVKILFIVKNDDKTKELCSIFESLKMPSNILKYSSSKDGQTLISFGLQGKNEVWDEQNILSFFYEYKQLNSVGIISYLLPNFHSFCENPRTRLDVDFSNSLYRDPVIMMLVCFSYVFNSEERQNCLSFWADDIGRERFPKLCDKLIEVFDEPRDSFNKDAISSKIKDLLEGKSEIVERQEAEDEQIKQELSLIKKQLSHKKNNSNKEFNISKSLFIDAYKHALSETENDENFIDLDEKISFITNENKENYSQYLQALPFSTNEELIVIFDDSDTESKLPYGAAVTTEGIYYLGRNQKTWFYSWGDMVNDDNWGKIGNNAQYSTNFSENGDPVITQASNYYISFSDWNGGVSNGKSLIFENLNWYVPLWSLAFHTIYLYFTNKSFSIDLENQKVLKFDHDIVKLYQCALETTLKLMQEESMYLNRFGEHFVFSNLETIADITKTFASIIPLEEGELVLFAIDDTEDCSFEQCYVVTTRGIYNKIDVEFYSQFMNVDKDFSNITWGTIIENKMTASMKLMKDGRSVGVFKVLPDYEDAPYYSINLFRIPLSTIFFTGMFGQFSQDINSVMKLFWEIE